MSKPKGLSNDLLDAVRSKDLEAAKCVVALGAKVTSDALVAAAENASVELLYVLLEAPGGKAELNTCNSQGSFPLRAAIMGGDYECMQLLISQGADVNYESSRGTPLMQACHQGDVDTINLLLDQGASIEHEGRDGETPLMVAAREDRREAVKLLLKRGADPSHKSSTGMRGPLEIAEEKGLVEVYSLLLQSSVTSGADKAIRDSEARQAAAVRELDAELEAGRASLAVEAEASRQQVRSKVQELQAEREALMAKLGITRK